jgi:hypothetical protein
VCASVHNDDGEAEEADMEQSWIGLAAGAIVLALVAMSTRAHYRRERRRADLLRHLDHHDWCRWTRARR